MLQFKRLIAIAATSLSLTATSALSQLYIACDRGRCSIPYYPGWNSNPWYINAPVGGGSEIAADFSKVIFSGNSYQLAEYTTRNKLTYAHYLEVSAYNQSSSIIVNNGIRGGKLWGHCLTVAEYGSTNAAPSACVDADDRGRPLDPKMASRDYRRLVLSRWKLNIEPHYWWCSTPERQSDCQVWSD